MTTVPSAVVVDWQLGDCTTGATCEQTNKPSGARFVSLGAKRSGRRLCVAVSYCACRAGLHGAVCGDFTTGADAPAGRS